MDIGPPAAAPENSSGPRTDYRQFIDYITDPNRVAFYPDIVTLQEAGTAKWHLRSCHEFELKLEAKTALDYYCIETTKGGGTAIVYNLRRLRLQKADHDEVEVLRISSTGGCNPSGDYFASVGRFIDLADMTKFVNVESVHLPNTNYPSTDHTGWAKDCAWNNMKVLSPGVTGFGSAEVQVMAGDWNHTDVNASTNNSWECWYSATNTPDLGGCLDDKWGWKDAMYRECAVSTPTSIYSCLQAKHQSYGSSRIDFLFAKAYAVSRQVTVPYPDAYASAGSPAGTTNQYSDHRGQGALLKYAP
jgi:hypothetical protein